MESMVKDMTEDLMDNSLQNDRYSKEKIINALENASYRLTTIDKLLKSKSIRYEVMVKCRSYYLINIDDFYKSGLLEEALKVLGLNNWLEVL